MNVLGLHMGHDSSSVLIQDGSLTADVAEERFTRIKHYNGIPYAGLEYCLREGNIPIEDVDVVAVSSRFPVPGLNYLFDLNEQQREKKNFRSQALDAYRKYFGGNQRMPPLYIKRHKLSSRTRIVHVEHHVAHAGSAYYSSGLGRDEKALIVTCDGMGDGWSVCIWRGENGRITPLKKFGTNGSLGWFYSNVTEALGWIHGDGEGKTMGLAPYGDAEKCRGCLDAFYPKYASGDLVEPYDFGSVYYWDECGSAQFHFDDADKIRRLIDRHGRENIAAEAQRVLEEQLVALITYWLEKEKTDILCAAGGVFLNVKLNQRLWCSGKIRKHWTYPNCGDSGLAYGAAMAAWFEENSGDLPLLGDLYSGPAFGNEEIRTMLEHRRIPAEYVENIEDETAELLAQNKIVGWFQGRMESGPRALGARSILMSAGCLENKDTINARVKYREGFRPFCPSMPIECAPQYLVKFRPEPFMITSFDAAPGKRDGIPAVVHQDGTARPQTVVRDTNTRYWTLLRRYGELSGHPVLLNTSMNIMGEPIVCNPRDAIKCFFDSGMDALALGNFLLTKRDL
ncbi:MAG TPA: carbamoyltransferase C-terminal domain-containing protein [Bryobacteraceae bacterium]|nr:carbamoyltransferase C-terminal domain-containing protein [Bryobacteraceae bacterium]